MTKKTTALALMVLAVASVVLPAEFPLELKTLTLQETLAFPGSDGQMAQLVTAKPESISRQPAASSKYPIYGVLATDGESRMAFRLDESKGTGKGYDALILDLNRNGDLTDDPVTQEAQKNEEVVGQMEQSLFGPIAVPAAQSAGPWRPSLCAEMLLYNRSMLKQRDNAFLGFLRVKPAGYLETTVEVNGVKQKIGVCDGNCNLRLGDPAAMEVSKRSGEAYWFLRPSDTLLRDRNGDGQFDSDDVAAESEPFSEIVYFGPTPYSLTLAGDLKAVRVEPYSGAVGELKIEKAGAVRSLTVGWEKSAGQWRCLTPGVGPDGEFKAPVGAYRVYTCSLAGKAKGGAVVAVSGMQRKAEGSVRIEPGQSAGLPCGAPLDLKVVANTRTQQRGGGWFRSAATVTNVDINIQVVGAGGENYSAYRIADKNRVARPKPPQFRVLGENRKEIAAGQLEYG